jgi:hypothetical protein
MGEKFLLESALVQPVRRHLYSSGVRKLQNEMQFYDYRLDIYGYSKRVNATYAVELKLKRWKRAFEQALIYQLCADFVYIALPSAGASLVDLPLLEAHGIGLIAVQTERRCVKVLASKQSDSVSEEYRKFYIDLVQGSMECQ